jgi:hypothetical protein
VSTHQAVHLNKDQRLWALVDKARLTDASQAHLKECPLCRSKKQRLKNELSALGAFAAQSVPKPQKQVRLPPTISPSRKRHGWYWQTAMGTAVAALLVIGVIWWPGMGLRVSDTSPPMATWSQTDDETFMAQIRDLTENELPQVYLDISEGLDAGADEEFIDFIVPSLDPDALSYHSANRRSLS